MAEENNETQSNETMSGEIAALNKLNTLSEPAHEEQHVKLATDEQIIECLEEIVKKKKPQRSTDKKKPLKPKIVSLAENQELHIKLPEGVKTCAITFI